LDCQGLKNFSKELLYYKNPHDRQKLLQEVIKDCTDLNRPYVILRHRQDLEDFLIVPKVRKGKLVRTDGRLAAIKKHGGLIILDYSLIERSTYFNYLFDTPKAPYSILGFINADRLKKEKKKNFHPIS